MVSLLEPAPTPPPAESALAAALRTPPAAPVPSPQAAAPLPPVQIQVLQGDLSCTVYRRLQQQPNTSISVQAFSAAGLARCACPCSSQGCYSAGALLAGSLSSHPCPPPAVLQCPGRPDLPRNCVCAVRRGVAHPPPGPREEPEPALLGPGHAAHRDAVPHHPPGILHLAAAVAAALPPAAAHEPARAAASDIQQARRGQRRCDEQVRAARKSAWGA